MSHSLQQSPLDQPGLDTLPEQSTPESPSWLDRKLQRFVEATLAKIRRDGIRLVTPDGRSQVFGDATSPNIATLRVHDWSFFRRLVVGSDVAFGEMWMEGVVSSDNLALLLTIFCNNQGKTRERSFLSSKLAQLGNRIFHLLRSNTLTGSRKNIQAHYDLSNEFFSLFLDETMTYSAALWRDESQSLKEAQLEKIHTLLRKAELRPEHHLLEIGSGWGALAIEAVKTYGCRVTTITLSDEQFALAKKRFEEAGVADRVDIRLCDYRNIEGTYDRIISVEMIEAVGQEYLGTFFKRCDELLAEGGRAVIQAITLADQRYASYLRETDWIQKYIFPGCCVPSVSALCEAMRDHSCFILDDMENIGIHYARTLREWRETFMSRLDDVKALGFNDRFCRMWEYYLAYCEAGFRTQVLNDMHMVLIRPVPVTGYRN